MDTVSAGGAQPTPKWDLQTVLGSLCHPPYEPMTSADLKCVSNKTAFLLAITSAKRVGELHALSMSDNCMSWSPDGASVQIRPNIAFLPKVLPRSYVNAPVMFAQYRKQRLSHWITDVIWHAYTMLGLDPPRRLKAHSTRAMATSWAALRGVSLKDMCAAASWASPNTFARFYRMNIADPPPLSVAVQSVQLASGQ